MPDGGHVSSEQNGPSDVAAVSPPPGDLTADQANLVTIIRRARIDGDAGAGWMAFLRQRGLSPTDLEPVAAALRTANADQILAAIIQSAKSLPQPASTEELDHGVRSE
jgi:hypothetical protein